MNGNLVDGFLAAIEGASIPHCEAFAENASMDATVPNWMLTVNGSDAIRAELAQWYADRGTFEHLKRTPLPGGELVEFTLCWEEAGVPHAVHQIHVLDVGPDGISSDKVWCGGRWPASLLAEMAEAANGHG